MKPQSVGAMKRKPFSRNMHTRQSFPKLQALLDLWSPRPHAFEKRHERRVPSGQFVQNASLAIANRKRTRYALCRKVLHQPEEERKILPINPLFIDGQDELARRRVHQIVGVFDALGDAFEQCLEGLAKAEAERNRIAAEAHARDWLKRAMGESDARKLWDAVESEKEAARIALWKDTPQRVAAAFAMQTAASKLDKVNHLNITPDMLRTLLEELAAERAGK